MRWSTVAGVAAALAVLAYGSVLVFLAFDRNSNSASDTIRPFIITMPGLGIGDLVGRIAYATP